MTFLGCLSVFLIPFLSSHAFSTVQPAAFLGRSTTSHRPEMALSGIQKGTIVTVEWDLQPLGDFVPEPLFDISGNITFILGGGNYLPGLHDLIVHNFTQVGDSLENVVMDAGWGARNPNLVATIQKSDLDDATASQIKIGTELVLANGLQCTVTEVTDSTFTMDGNQPLAGATYYANVKLLNVEKNPLEKKEYTPTPSGSKYQLATFALGCFWGGELEYMRVDGVVGSKVGYTQGTVDDPSYEAVCAGTTGHTEAIMITYDETIVSYESLVRLAMDRLGENKYLENQVASDVGTQYRHGVYYHNSEQKEVATEVVGSFGPDCKTEVLPAKTFWDAEDYHQQYLLKGGQSAKKGDDSPIRCYG